MTDHRPPLRVAELAQLLGVDETTVHRAIRRHEIHANRIGRLLLVPATEVDRLVDAPHVA